MRKKAKRYVILHKPTGTFLKTFSWRSINGSIKPSIHCAVFVTDVNDAKVLASRTVNMYSDLFQKYIIVDKKQHNNQYHKIDLEIKEVEVSYTVI